MWSFEMYNELTGEREIIFGYSLKTAIANTKFESPEWACVLADYED